MLSMHQTLQTRSDRVTELLNIYRRPGEVWSSYLRAVCRLGEVFHSRRMFDLFLSLIDDGTLEGLRPGFAINDDWWSVLYSVTEKRPDFACEAIAHWFDRIIMD